MQPFLTLNKIIPRIPNTVFSLPITWQINKGEIWSIFGSNGCGKTLLTEVLCGRYLLDQGVIKYHFFGTEIPAEIEKARKDLHKAIRVISFNAAYSLADFRAMYYQQRYNNSENDTVPSVSDLFDLSSQPSAMMEEVFGIFDIKKLMNRRLVHLSSGELRKILIARALSDNPRMLIFDNPFIGLDVDSRNHLNEIFVWLNKREIQLIFLIPSIGDMPACTTDILQMDKLAIVSIGKTRQIINKFNIDSNLPPAIIDWQKVPCNSDAGFTVAVRMEEVDVTYDQDIICDHINWVIRNGEKWALLGPNGSGKSTLLSYIFADNPQAYAKNLTLFDRKRGTGESIWDIKKRIGFTSSELHLYYRQNISCLEIVESGFFDSIGLHHNSSEEQTAIAHYLLKILNLTHLTDKSFLKVSSGEQRRLLLARALVKNPPLLILDEPFHGMDDSNKRLCLGVVESYCAQPFKTLIYVTHHEDEIPTSVKNIFRLPKAVNPNRLSGI